jgi:hypothetical protein
MRNASKPKAIALSLETPSAINKANSLLLASMVMAAMVTVPGVARAQQAASSSDTTAASGSAAPPPQTATPDDSLAEAARKAKAQKAAQAAKPAKVFTNDNLPTDASGISTVGAKGSDNAAAADASASSSGQGEKYWREKFAELNKKLEQDQSELDVMQRELGQLNLQNYSDPVQAMQQGYSRSDINDKTAAIDAKQKAVDADKQAITDAEDDLRKSGGDSGWER